MEVVTGHGYLHFTSENGGWGRCQTDVVNGVSVGAKVPSGRTPDYMILLVIWAVTDYAR